MSGDTKFWNKFANKCKQILPWNGGDGGSEINCTSVGENSSLWERIIYMLSVFFLIGRVV